jgi:hypothetical protein
MFKILGLLILLILFVPVFRRFLFQILVGNEMAKQQRRYNDMMNKTRKEGEVKVDTNIKKTPNNNAGQYIDYEEVK